MTMMYRDIGTYNAITKKRDGRDYLNQWTINMKLRGMVLTMTHIQITFESSNSQGIMM